MVYNRCCEGYKKPCLTRFFIPFATNLKNSDFYVEMTEMAVRKIMESGMVYVGFLNLGYKL